jgi:hypothetical protein
MSDAARNGTEEVAMIEARRRWFSFISCQVWVLSGA